jgi:solute carrier family 25 (mitochondrial iron transporter), member 28/37
VILLPIDIVKTYKQALPQTTRYTDVYFDLKARTGGLSNLWRGASVMAAGSIPAHALFFSIYELLNNRLELRQSSEMNPIKHAMIGAICSFCHDIVIVPCEAIKQRCQLSDGKPIQIIRKSIQAEGYRGLWRSFPVTFLMNFPYQAAVFSTNECLKKISTKHRINHTFWTHFMCASLAGLTACVLTMPLDVLKTQLNTSRFLSPSSNPIPEQKECRGWSRMFRGLGPRVLTQTLAVGTCWSVYGFFKELLTNQHAN